MYIELPTAEGIAAVPVQNICSVYLEKWQDEKIEIVERRMEGLFGCITRKKKIKKTFDVWTVVTFYGDRNHSFRNVQRFQEYELAEIEFDRIKKVL